MLTFTRALLLYISLNIYVNIIYGSLYSPQLSTAKRMNFATSKKDRVIYHAHLLFPRQGLAASCMMRLMSERLLTRIFIHTCTCTYTRPRTTPYSRPVVCVHCVRTNHTIKGGGTRQDRQARQGKALLGWVYLWKRESFYESSSVPIHAFVSLQGKYLFFSALRIR